MKRIKGMLAVVLAVGTLAGCGGTSSSDTVQVRVVNAMPGLTSATVVAGVSFVMEGGGYATTSSYASVGTGSSQLILVTDGSGNTVAETSATFTKGYQYTVVLAGTLSNPVILPEQLDQGVPASGKARFHLTNVSQTRGSVDVYITQSSTDISSASPTISALTTNSDTSVLLGADTYRVRFTANGTKTVLADYTVGSVAAGDLPHLYLLDTNASGSAQQVISLSDK